MRSFSLPLILLSLIFSSALNAATYKWTDENGNVVYSQQPPKSGKYELIKGLHHSTSKPEPQTYGSASETNSKEKSFISNNGDKQVSTADLEKQRKEYCETAKKNLQGLTVYRRFKNEDGTITRMDDNERQKLIEEAKEQIKEFCD